MTPTEPTGPTFDVREWLDRVREALAAEAELPLSPAEQRALLDIARVAAHTSERIAAPLSTYLAGLALASVAPGDRPARLEALLRQLEPPS